MITPALLILPENVETLLMLIPVQPTASVPELLLVMPPEKAETLLTVMAV